MGASTNTMKIAIEGYDRNNFGDVLMAAATLQLAASVWPDAHFLLPRRLDYPSARPRQTTTQSALLSRIPLFGSRRSSYRISQRTLSSPPDLVLYCCGFIFGDFWPTAWIAGLAEDFEILRARGCRLVLMPQSFGPFSDPEKAHAVKRALVSAASVYARDASSFAHLSSLGADIRAVSSCDYTSVLTASEPASEKKNQLCIVPNIKIAEAFGEQAVAPYLEQLRAMAEVMRHRTGCKVVVLTHTLAKDRAIAARLTDVLSDMTPRAVSPQTAQEARSQIAESRFVISSRFHALVNALSLGVPCLAVGWTHKYEGIIALYEQHAGLVQPGDKSAGQRAAEAIVANEDDIKQTLGRRRLELERSLIEPIRHGMQGA